VARHIVRPHQTMDIALQTLATRSIGRNRVRVTNPLLCNERIHVALAYSSFVKRVPKIKLYDIEHFLRVTSI
jgi:hypothetical protein